MIKKWGKRVIDYFFNPCPTLFDLCVCFGIMGISFIAKPLRGFYLEFYTIFLVIIGFHYKEKRRFDGASLTLLCLLGLISLFVHSFYANIGGLSFQYLNFYLMHEGFGYIFFSALLFYVVVTKATNLRLLAFTLPIVILPWVRIMLYSGQMTPLLALGVGFCVYLLYKRRFLILGIIALAGLCVVYFNYDWLLMKFSCRPHVWKDLLLRIKDHPFVGSGFNKLLIKDHFILVGSWGGTWLYRHQDFLSLMAYIGAFALIPIGLFIKELAVRFKRTWFIAPLIAFCALCFFQITFIYATRVIIILLSCAWMWIEVDYQNRKLKEES